MYLNMIQKRIKFVCQCLSFLFLILGYSEKLRASFGCHSGDRKKKRIKCIIQVPNGNLQEWVLQLSWKGHFIASTRAISRGPAQNWKAGKPKRWGLYKRILKKKPLNRYQIQIIWTVAPNHEPAGTLSRSHRSTLFSIGLSSWRLTCKMGR